MFLYKLEVVTEDSGSLVVIMLAESDEKAFAYAEQQIRREFEVAPKVTEMTLVEKKYVEKAKGYLIKAAVL